MAAEGANQSAARYKIVALSSINQPVQTVLVRKVGASFLKNLFYFFDHFRLPPKKIDIENNEGLHFKAPLPQVLPFEDLRFVLFRDPLERFIAFYFDQICGENPPHWLDWQQNLIARGARFGDDISDEQHQKNIVHLVRQVKDISAASGFTELPDQLAPQYKFLLPAIDNGFDPIDLARANIELNRLLAPYVDNPRQLINRVSRRVKLVNDYRDRNIITKTLIDEHKALYLADFELYWAYRDGF